jgi:hypothetical protein
MLPETSQKGKWFLQCIHEHQSHHPRSYYVSSPKTRYPKWKKRHVLELDDFASATTNYNIKSSFNDSLLFRDLQQVIYHSYINNLGVGCSVY